MMRSKTFRLGYRAGTAWPGAWVKVIAALLLCMMAASRASAYSVLTHEEVVDLVWKDDIVPLLKGRFPKLTDDDLVKAHSYAYGGAVIQDLGYYPLSSPEFSDLVHYVRSGDFVDALIKQSADANEFAFALGALAHYASDIIGHPAVNRSVALEYPKLQARFGNIVRYADDKTSHLRTEFGFDMVQVAKKRYAPEQYHDFIGFQVSKELLERVFPIVYGLQLSDVLPRENVAIGSYRFAVSQVIPEMTKVALKTHKAEIMRETPNFAKRKFLYRISRTEYEKSWGKDYTRPGFGTRLLALIIRLLPKIGPLKALAFKSPTPQTEDLYFKSINTTIDQYHLYLGQVRQKSLKLTNSDFDTGQITRAAEYSLTDNTYSKLLGQLSDQKYKAMSKELRANIIAFYSDLSLPIATKKDPEKWQKTLKQIEEVKVYTPAPGASDVVAEEIPWEDSVAAATSGGPVPDSAVSGGAGSDSDEFDSAGDKRSVVAGDVPMTMAGDAND